MTTTIKVTAHCADKLEVLVRVQEGNNEVDTILQNGESVEVYAYDSRVISVQERKKEE